MEKSIDSARTRRVSGGDPETVDAPRGPIIGGKPPVDPRAIAARPASPAHPASPGNVVIGASPLIGGPSHVAPPSQAAPSPDQPPRLKAKPKRFESTFAAQYSQAQYRTQAG